MMRLLLLGLPLFFAMLSAISWGVKKVKDSPLFKIHEVLVDGDLEVDCGDLIGMNILDINSEVLRERYEDERVRLVGVRRKFPGRVVVEVEERRPCAILELEMSYEVDRDGYILRETGRSSSQSTVDADQKPLSVVRILTTRDRRGVWELYAEKIMDFLLGFTENFGDVDRLTLYDDDLVVKTRRKEIHLGHGRWTERLDKLTSVDLSQLDASRIDLRFESQVVVRK